MPKKANDAMNDALKSLGIPYQRIIYTGSAAPYVVYQVVVDREVAHSDDDELGREVLYLVRLFSKTDSTALEKRLRQALKTNGFYGITGSGEIYESETRMYCIPVECRYLEV